MRTSDLPEKISRELIEDIALGALPPDSQIKTEKLAQRFGVSRTPIRDTLELLADKGLVEQKPHRGFFVTSDAQGKVKKLLAQAPSLVTSDEYHQIAEDWLAERLPSEVTIKMLQDRYGLSKARLQVLLARAGREGWAEQKPGYGWRLLPVARTPEAFSQIYRFRMIVEPAAMLEPTFELDRKVVDEQRRIQEGMLERDIDHASPERLVSNGPLFHEELIKMSGNQFFHLSLVRVNRMRRLMEYRAKFDRERFTRQCTEHLQILESLESGDLIATSYLMRRHLAGALDQKVPVATTWFQPSPLTSKGSNEKGTQRAS